MIHIASDKQIDKMSRSHEMARGIIDIMRDGMPVRYFFVPSSKQGYVEARDPMETFKAQVRWHWVKGFKTDKSELGWGMKFYMRQRDNPLKLSFTIHVDDLARKEDFDKNVRIAGNMMLKAMKNPDDPPPIPDGFNEYTDADLRNIPDAPPGV